MPSEESGVNKQDIVSQAALAPVTALSITPPPPSANANESLSQSHSLIDSRNLVINDGQFNQTRGHHTSLVINFNQGTPEDSRSSSPPSNEIRHISPARTPEDSRSSSPPSNEIRHISPAQFSGQSSQVDHEMPQVSSQSHEISKSNDIYERHLTLKGRGFPLWIPGPNRRLHLNYQRTGVRIGDVGVITGSGAFSFLFNICLPHNDPVNPRILPEHFAPISPPIEDTDIEDFTVFKNGSHLASASVKRSQTGTAISDIVFESSASEGAILTMPRGARSEDLGNPAAFREYAAANVANWYRYVNGRRGREAKNGDVRLVVGFDKTTSWGIATFANQTQVTHQNSCRLKFGPSEGDPASTYTWLEKTGVADWEVGEGPDSDERDKLRIASDPPDVQFENQCLFVRTLNVTLADDVWADIHSGSGSIPVDPRNSQYPRVKNYSDSNRPHSNNPSNSSNFSPSQGPQSGTQRRLQGADITSDENPPIFVSGPVESITVHPSKILNDTLLAKIPTAKMAITHDDDWSSVTQCDTLLDPQEFVANILASRDIYEENGVVFLQPKKTIDEISEGSTSVNRAPVRPDKAFPPPKQMPLISKCLHYLSERFFKSLSYISGRPAQDGPAPPLTSPTDDHHQPPQSCKRKALLVGVESINERPLTGPHKDARDMRQFLIDHCDYDPDNIILLINTDDPDAVQPTKKNIEKHCMELVAGACDGDRFVFHFAGHTMQKPTDSDEEEDGKDEYIATSDDEIIQDNTLRKMLVDPLPAGAKLVALFDACNSATLLDLEHHRCNRVYVPWVNKGVRRTKSKWSNVGPSLRSTSIALGSVPDGSDRLYNCPETPMICCDSPLSRFCTGHCKTNNSYLQQLHLSDLTGNDKADVICLSFAKDSQRSWQTPQGSLTQVLLGFLKNTPNATIKAVLTGVSHELHTFYLDMHRDARKYKQDMRDFNIKRGKKGKQPQRRKTVEMDNFQDPQISSHKPLDMNRLWEM